MHFPRDQGTVRRTGRSIVSPRCAKVELTEANRSINFSVGLGAAAIRNHLLQSLLQAHKEISVACIQRGDDAPTSQGVTVTRTENT